MYPEMHMRNELYSTGQSAGCDVKFHLQGRARQVTAQAFRGYLCLFHSYGVKHTFSHLGLMIRTLMLLTYYKLLY